MLARASLAGGLADAHAALRHADAVAHRKRECNADANATHTRTVTSTAKGT